MLRAPVYAIFGHATYERPSPGLLPMRHEDAFELEPLLLHVCFHDMPP